MLHIEFRNVLQLGKNIKAITASDSIGRLVSRAYGFENQKFQTRAARCLSTRCTRIVK